MNLLTTLKQALEALENSFDTVQNEYLNDWRHSLPTRKGRLAAMKLHDKAIDNLHAAIEQMEEAEPTAFAVQLAEDGGLSWNTIWEERWAANDHLNSLLQEGLHKGECHVVSLYAYPPDAQAEIERLTKERNAFQDQCIALKIEREMKK